MQFDAPGSGFGNRKFVREQARRHDRHRIRRCDSHRQAGGAVPATAAATPSNPIERVADSVATYRNVTLPAGTVLPVDLETAVGSDTSRSSSRCQDVCATRSSVGGAEVLPAGTALSGHVTAAQRPGKVKGRGY